MTGSTPFDQATAGSGPAVAPTLPPQQPTPVSRPRPARVFGAPVPSVPPLPSPKFKTSPKAPSPPLEEGFGFTYDLSIEPLVSSPPKASSSAIPLPSTPVSVAPRSPPPISRVPSLPVSIPSDGSPSKKLPPSLISFLNDVPRTCSTDVKRPSIFPLILGFPTEKHWLFCWSYDGLEVDKTGTNNSYVSFSSPSKLKAAGVRIPSRSEYFFFLDAV